MEILCGSSGVRSSPSEPDKQLPYSHEVRFTEKEPDVHNSRVIIGESSSTGFGKRKFISRAKLQSHSVFPNTKYLKDDCL